MAEISQKKASQTVNQQDAAPQNQVRVETSATLPPVQSSDFKAFQLYQAMNGGLTGWGTDEVTISKTLRGTVGPEYEQIQQSYQKHYGRSLEQDLKNELGSAYSELQKEISQPKEQADQSALADKQRKLEYALGNSDVKSVKEILTGLNSHQLAEVNAGIKQKLGSAQDLQYCLRHNNFSKNDLNELLALSSSDLPQRTAGILRQAMDGIGTSEDIVRNQLQGLSKQEVRDVEAAYSKITAGESLKTRLESELGGRDKLETTLALKGRPETAEELFAHEKARYDFERSGFLNLPSTAIMDTLSSKGGIYDQNFAALTEQYQQALATGKLTSAQAAELTRQASFCRQDNLTYSEAKESASTAISTSAGLATGVVLTVVQPELGLPTLYATAAGATTYAGTKMLTEGASYDSQSLAQDATIGAANAAVAAGSLQLLKGAGSALSASTTKTAASLGKALQTPTILYGADQLIGGTTLGALDTGLKQETWEDGILSGIAKTGEAGAITGAAGLALGSATGRFLGGKATSELKEAVDPKVIVHTLPDSMLAEIRASDQAIANSFPNKTLSTRPKVTINGETYEISHGATITVNDDVTLRESAPGMVWVNRNSDANYSHSLCSENPNVVVPTNEGAINIAFKQPDFINWRGRGLVDLDCLREPRFARLRSESRRCDDQAFMEWGRANALSAHGVDENKGGIQSLVGIASNGKLIGDIGTPAYWGSFIKEELHGYVGHHGPYYVFGNPYTDSATHFVVPNQEARDCFGIALGEATSKGFMTPERMREVLEHTYTFSEAAQSSTLAEEIRKVSQAAAA